MRGQLNWNAEGEGDLHDEPNKFILEQKFLVRRQIVFNNPLHTHRICTIPPPLNYFFISQVEIEVEGMGTFADLYTPSMFCIEVGPDYVLCVVGSILESVYGILHLFLMATIDVFGGLAVTASEKPIVCISTSPALIIRQFGGRV
ncbi:hypothetical protein CDAR_602391 [Caerostris darwini]|uniref:Uncharacterized protein n=1 Tax=Caerostris darwini TaxID=1538125 RepID=A0AAV4TZ31_9ARAC|nr:hypothetical protein CDAR_602391 [Caerostris darwini]